MLIGKMFMGTMNDHIHNEGFIAYQNRSKRLACCQLVGRLPLWRGVWLPAWLAGCVARWMAGLLAGRVPDGAAVSAADLGRA